jgi:hypothetical protein
MSESWRNRIRREVLAVLKEHDVFSTMEQVADDIADAMPSPDERNGFVTIPRAQHEAYVAAAKWWFAENTPPEGSEDCECASCKLYAALRAALEAAAKAGEE